MLHSTSAFLLPALMIVAAMTDVTTYKIPNWLTALIALLFFPMAYATGMPMQEFFWHLAAGVVLFIVGYALFAFRIFGGGDSKLMAAAGLWFGTGQSMQFLTMTALAGGAIAIAFGAWSMFIMGWEVHGPENKGSFGEQLKQITPKLPYGLAFAAGAIFVYPDTWWMQVA
jgi:prepilin peptidase CpaA